LGKLYVCGTPIGNLEDVSIRLLKTLRKVDMIACEDTRHTIKLLNRYKIKNRLISYHEHSRPEKEEYLLAELQKGSNIALVSDAGMPTISDPGEGLVRKAIAAGIDIEAVPGPSACTAALSISGLNSGSFVFEGFLPIRSGKRQAMLTALKPEHRTVILYEAPHRLVDVLEDMEVILGKNRSITIVRELTKMHQEVKRGPIGEIKCHYKEYPPRGEICLLIPAEEEKEAPIDWDQITRETMELIQSGMDKKEAFKMKAREYKVKKSSIYNLLHK